MTEIKTAMVLLVSRQTVFLEIYLTKNSFVTAGIIHCHQN